MQQRRFNGRMRDELLNETMFRKPAIIRAGPRTGGGLALTLIAARIACVVVVLLWRTWPMMLPSIPVKGPQHQTVGSNS
ncbi:MAG: hypothetical protein ACK5LJ_15395 [Paracoccus sp. (in: a-proteobacteria)]